MPRKPTRSTTDRGYGPAHIRERRRWKPRVDAGHVTCWRCGHLIIPGAPWDLGHDDNDRSKYRGPEHMRCNRLAGARQGAARRWGSRRRTTNVTAIRM